MPGVEAGAPRPTCYHLMQGVLGPALLRIGSSLAVLESKARAVVKRCPLRVFAFMSSREAEVRGELRSHVTATLQTAEGLGWEEVEEEEDLLGEPLVNENIC